MIVDFKSGGRSPVHRDDLRFYALIETLVHEVPPRRLVTYYLDGATCEVEDVSIDVLRAALRRMLDGIARHAELTVERRTAQRRAGDRLPVVSAGQRLCRKGGRSCARRR